MKSKILVTVIIVFCNVLNTISCPSWRIGKMYIVDEKNQPVTQVSVWQFSSLNDSFKMRKYGYDNNDTNAYNFWTGGGGYRFYSEEEVKPANKYILIQAEGYADVIIKELNFTGSRSRYDDDNLPVLYVKMYSQKYLKVGDLYTLIEQYVCERKLEVKDSLMVDFDDYIESLSEVSVVANAERVAAYVVRTYPNPVKDKLNIEINTPITKPYKVILLDVQGKLINETQLMTQRSILDMEWQLAGIYFIQVYDPEGKLLYAYKFVKT